MTSHFSRRLGLVLSICAASQLLGCVVTDRQPTAAHANQVMPSHDPNALLMAAELALQRKQFLLATQTLAAAAAASDEESLAERATNVAFENHQNTYVLKSAKRWLEINPSSEQAHRFAGVAAIRLYLIDDAVEHFNALLNTAFISSQAGFMTLGPQWQEEGSPSAVLELVQRLIKLQKESAEAQLVLAQAAKQAENSELALTSAKRAVELSPFWLPAKITLARLQLGARDRDGAIATIKAVLEQDGKAENRLEYAQILFAGGKEAEGRTELEALSDTPEVAAGARRALALIELDLGQFDASAKRWRELVQAGRFVYEGMFYLAQIAEHREMMSDAIELYSRVVTTDLAVPAQSRAARLKARAGKVADGIEVLQEFSKAHPEFAIDIAIAEASLLADLDTVNHGIDRLNVAHEEYPDNSSIRVSKALLLERGKRYSEAVREMRAIYHDRPNDPAVLNMLGYTLVDRTRNLDEGLAMIQRALQAMPDNGAVLDSMGWALHKQHRNDEAVVHLERAYEQARDPEIAIHLGEVQWSLGRQDVAIDTWEKASTAFPDHADLKKELAAHKRKAAK